MLYLASTSPRRHQLLRAAGLDFAAVPPGPEPAGAGTPAERAQQRARSKAAGAAPPPAPGWVLGADTVVDCGGVELGKPPDRDAARAMLRQLAGTVHQVHTALCVVGHPGGPVRERLCSARVRCAGLDDAAVEAYLDRGTWRGKAGGYGIQDDGGAFMTLVEGDLETVVGLPVGALRALLAGVEAR